MPPPAFSIIAREPLRPDARVRLVERMDLELDVVAEDAPLGAIARQAVERGQRVRRNRRAEPLDDVAVVVVVRRLDQRRDRTHARLCVPWNDSHENLRQIVRDAQMTAAAYTAAPQTGQESRPVSVPADERRRKLSQASSCWRRWRRFSGSFLAYRDSTVTDLGFAGRRRATSCGSPRRRLRPERREDGRLAASSSTSSRTTICAITSASPLRRPSGWRWSGSSSPVVFRCVPRECGQRLRFRTRHRLPGRPAALVSGSAPAANCDPCPRREGHRSAGAADRRR